MRFALLIFCTLALVTGCGRRGPLDDETLDILSRTGMHGADVTYPDGYTASLTPDDYDMMRSLIASLRPIKSAKQGTLDSYDYRLVYIAGMDPAIIEVKIVNDSELLYRWDEYLYTGGNSKRFRESVQAIRDRFQMVRGEQSPFENNGEPCDAPESPNRAI